MYGDEGTAEHAARRAGGCNLLGGTITVRGPAEQRRRGHSGTYIGKVGYVPTKKNDRRPYTDCTHYVSGDCVNGASVSMTGAVGKNVFLFIDIQIDIQTWLLLKLGSSLLLLVYICSVHIVTVQEHASLTGGKFVRAGKAKAAQT